MKTTGTAVQTASWDVSSVARLLESATTESGARLVELVEAFPVLLVFLRHSGCTFCREAVADIALRRKEIENEGTHIVLVHMGDRDGIEALVARHGLSDVDRICDTDRQLYQAFGLKRGNWRQLFGFKVWVRGLIAGIVRGHGLGRPSADPTQMPGVFFLERGLVARAFRHKSAADRPCYTKMCHGQEDR